jgi:hypothetical protein
MANDASGVSIEYRKRDKTVYISGWYDHFVGIEGQRVELIWLLESLEAIDDMEKAIRKYKKENTI